MSAAPQAAPGGRGPRAYGRALAVAAVAVAADQVTKGLARGSISPGERVEVGLGIDLVRVGNDGIAFGLLADAGPAVLVVATLAFVILLGFFLAHGDRARLWLPIGLIVGGAVGNLIDRVRDGFVTDFIDPPAWPAYNLADVEIVVGAAIMMLVVFRDGDPDSGEPSDPEPPGAGAGEGGTGPGAPDR